MSTAAQTVYEAISLGDAFVNSPEYKAHNPFRGQGYRVELKAAGDPIDLRPAAPGIARARQLPQTVVDFCTTIRTTGGSVYTGVTGVSTLLPTPVLQGSASKPGLDAAVTAAIVLVETIAGYYKASLKALDDVVGAMDMIDSKLAARVRLVEQNQILTGNGTSPQLQGLASVTAIPAATDVSAGVATVRANGYSPNVVAINPADSLKIVTNTFNAYDSTFGTESVYGCIMVYSNALPVGTGYVGDFLQGATLYRRDDFHVIVGNVNDDIIKNLVTLVGESRLAFLVNDPAAFAKITIT